MVSHHRCGVVYGVVFSQNRISWWFFPLNRYKWRGLNWKPHHQKPRQLDHLANRFNEDSFKNKFRVLDLRKQLWLVSRSSTLAVLSDYHELTQLRHITDWIAFGCEEVFGAVMSSNLAFCWWIVDLCYPQWPFYTKTVLLLHSTANHHKPVTPMVCASVA